MLQDSNLQLLAETSWLHLIWRRSLGSAEGCVWCIHLIKLPTCPGWGNDLHPVRCSAASHLQRQTFGRAVAFKHNWVRNKYQLSVANRKYELVFYGTVHQQTVGLFYLLLCKSVNKRKNKAYVFLLWQNIFHGSMSLDQLYLARPLPSMSDYRSPVKGLYMCGSGSHPGLLLNRWWHDALKMLCF